jgi:hypothetical protein
MWPEETVDQWNNLWGDIRSKHTHDTLALEALSGWEPTNCGAGVIRSPHVSTDYYYWIINPAILIFFFFILADSSGSYSQYCFNIICTWE